MVFSFGILGHGQRPVDSVEHPPDLFVDARLGARDPDRAVHRSGSLVLSSRSSNYQPVVHGTVEVEVRCPELELGVASRSGCAVFVLRHKAEAGFSGQARIGRVRAGR